MYCQCLDFVEVSHRHRVYPLMYVYIDILGHLNADRLKRSVSLSGRIVPQIFCGYDFKKGRFANLGYTADDVVKYVEEQSRLLLRQDLSCNPQLQIFITPKYEHDNVVIVMSHILADGQGFLQYLYLLAEIYNGSQPDKDIQNMRDITPLLEGIHVITYAKNKQYNKNISMLPLRSMKSGDDFLCLTTQIPADIMKLIHQRAREAGATMNDVFMTAYARVLSRLQKTTSVFFPCPADLRKFHSGLNSLTVANMTGVYRRITVEIPMGCSFFRTLQQVHAEMELQKGQYRCFAGIKALNRIFCKVPRNLLERGIKAAYRLTPVSYTNLGIINHEKLYFKGCIIQDCFFTGTYRHAPDFQLTVSTYKNVCTLNCTLLGDENDDKNGRYILEQIKNEIMDWIRC